MAPLMSPGAPPAEASHAAPPADATIAESPLTPKALADLIGRIDPSSRFAREASRLLDRVLVDGPLPASLPRLGDQRLLTVAMVAEDFDGVYFSIQAIRLYHPEIADDVQFLVLDPRPDAPHAEPLRGLAAWIEGYTYWPHDRRADSDLRDLAFRHGSSEFVLVMDPGVLFLPGSLLALIRYLQERRPERDLLQGPLLSSGSHLPAATHSEPGWQTGRWGTPAFDARAHGREPFEIGMQDLGVLACRRDAWPGIDPRLSGAGSLAGYLHEKFRRAGGRTLCLPFLRWQRRAPPARREDVPLPAAFRDYLLMYEDLGLDPQPVREHFGSLLRHAGGGVFGSEPDGRFAPYDAIYCVCRDGDSRSWWRARERLAELGMEGQVRWMPAVSTPIDPRIGDVLSRRAIVEEARWQGLRSLLVLDREAALVPELLGTLRSACEGPDRPRWGVVGWAPGEAPRYLQEPGVGATDLACLLVQAPALAMQRAFFEPVLAAIPPTPGGVAQWLWGSPAPGVAPLGHRPSASEPRLSAERRTA